MSFYFAFLQEDAGHCASFYQKHRQFAEIGMCTDAISPFVCLLLVFSYHLSASTLCSVSARIMT